MTTGATFGEILRSAHSHLAAATRLSRTRLSAGAVIAATREASSVVIAMSRYLDDLIPHSSYAIAVTRDMEPSARALADAREALGLAAAALSSETGESGRAFASDETSAEPLAARLAQSATAMTAGRDLLRTHFTTGTDGLPIGHSDWSTVITSPPVTQALLEEIGRWAQQIALLGARLTPAAAQDPDIPLPVSHGLAAACHWVLIASTTMTSSRLDAGAPDAGLLRAIPSGVVPERGLPSDAETVDDLCDGAVTSAIRLRVMSRQTAGEGTWSETATAASWRWTAKAAAVVCHLSELMLTQAADRIGFAGAQPDLQAQLNTAAAAAGHACTRWREAAAAWTEMTTETRGLDAPRIGDASDLVVRLGRLATGDPMWIPSRAPRMQLRSQADLFHSRARVTGVLSAVHHAADALTCVAAADVKEVLGAARAGRLYVPTWTLPEEQDVSRPFGPATDAQVQHVLDAYHAAADACLQGARAIDRAAITLDAPSRMLAVARAATETSGRRRDHPIRSVGKVPDLRDNRGRRQPGPVEQAVRSIGVGDEILVLRAAAIDKAARLLIAEAEKSAAGVRKSRPTADATRQDSPASAVAENFPQGPVTVTAKRMSHRDPDSAGLHPAAGRSRPVR